MGRGGRGSTDERFAGWFGRFGRLGGRGPGRGGGRHLVRVDLCLADVGDAFLDDQLGGTDVPKQFRLGLDLDLLLGIDIAGDLAAHDDGLRVDIPIDDRGVAERQHAVRLDFAVQLAFKGQFTGKLEVALDFNIRAEDVFS